LPESPISEFAPPELRSALQPTPPATPAPRRERRGRGQRRVAWAGGRARNVLRHPGQLGVVAGIVFTIALITLILVPQQAQRAFARLAPRPNEWRGTAAAVAAVERARAEHAVARQAFLAAREAATAPSPAPRAPAFVLSPPQVLRRDSLLAAADALQRGLARVERSPLPASYRALGELPELAGQPRVAALLDSLSAVEREREEFAALGGVDPVYVALTTRVNAIGRAIQEVATGQVAAAATELAALRPPALPPPPVVERPMVDTLAPLQRVVTAEETLRDAERRLEMDRRVNAGLTARAEEARRGVDFVAPPFAVFTAAGVLALVAGYLAVLVAELRTPRVADEEEVERETGRRVLAVVRHTAPSPERGRRRADERTPDVLEPASDAYRLLYLHISPTGASLPIVTVTGDEPAVVATVAANLAAASAEDARSTLLLDADLTGGIVASALRVRPAPGVSELLRDEASWSDVVTAAVFGRERVVDVIPAGRPIPRGREPAPGDAFRLDLLRMARRYDLTVVTAPLSHAARGARSILPSPDVILCVRAAATRVHDLRTAVDALHGAGLRVQGVVLWDDDLPTLEPYSPAEWRARARTVEAEQLTEKT
jgi:Mrp family chromosome partitioning ATPase